MASRHHSFVLSGSLWGYFLSVIHSTGQAVIPDLASMIEVKETATALTNWLFIGNPRGVIYGFEQSMDNANMNRIDNRTPIKGL